MMARMLLTDGLTDNPTASNTSTELGEGTFKIQYVTPGSIVTGDYISDNFHLGANSIKNLTMGVASSAEYVSVAIMGVGFDLDESILATSNTPYPNIIDEMVKQGLINSRAYSLWLDDLSKSKFPGFCVLLEALVLSGMRD